MDISVVSKENYFSSNDELKAVIALDKKLFPFPWSEKSWIDFMQNSKFILSLGKVNADVIGFSLFSVNEIEGLGHLLKIVVAKEYRGNDYGQMLHSVIEQELRAVGLEKLYLEVATENLPAINLYKQLGYKQLVIKKNFYSNGDDAFAMQKVLK